MYKTNVDKTSRSTNLLHYHIFFLVLSAILYEINECKKSINQCVHIKIDEIGVVAFVKKLYFM